MKRAKRPLRDTSTRIVETGDYVMGVRIYAETGPVRSRGEWSAEQLYIFINGHRYDKIMDVMIGRPGGSLSILSKRPRRLPDGPPRGGRRKTSMVLNI